MRSNPRRTHTNSKHSQPYGVHAATPHACVTEQARRCGLASYLPSYPSPCSLAPPPLFLLLPLQSPFCAPLLNTSTGRGSNRERDWHSGAILAARRRTHLGGAPYVGRWREEASFDWRQDSLTETDRHQRRRGADPRPSPPAARP